MLPGPERSDTPQVAPEGTLTVLSSNVEYGGADIDEITRLAEQGVDAIALQEVTPEFEGALETSGLLEAFPHRVGTARDDAGGTMLLSRTPVELVDSTEGTVFDNLLVTTTIDGTLWHLAAVRTAPPRMGAESWTADAATVGEMVAPHTEENLLLVGDLDAIAQHHTMRELTADGSLAAPGRGRGVGLWEPAWPVGHSVPPFARIGHAIVGPRVESPVPSCLTNPGTDHRALRVQVSPVAQGGVEHSPDAQSIVQPGLRQPTSAQGLCTAAPLEHHDAQAATHGRGQDRRDAAERPHQRIHHHQRVEREQGCEHPRRLSEHRACTDPAHHGEHPEARRAHPRHQPGAGVMHQQREEQVEHDRGEHHAQCTGPADPEIVVPGRVQVDHVRHDHQATGTRRAEAFSAARRGAPSSGRRTGAVIPAVSRG